MGMTLKKEIIIKSLDKIDQNKLPEEQKGHSFVAVLKVWADVSLHEKAVGEKDRWEYYYYQHAFKNKWEREYPEKAIRAYYGSAGGDRKANVKLMETIKKSSKSVEIKILWYGKTEDAAEREQHHTTKHNWPITGAKSTNCWNGDNAHLGVHTIPKEIILSEIQYEMLSDELIRFDNGEKDLFPVAPVISEYLKEFIAYEQWVQSRTSREGNEESIGYYEEQLQDPTVEWQGKGLIYLPEGATPEDIDKPEVRAKMEGGDGNQSSRALIRVNDRTELDFIFVSYERHKHMILTDKESIGNERNRFGKIREDHVRIPDAIRNIINLLNDYNLFTKIQKNRSGGTPKIEHPKVKARLLKLNLSLPEIKDVKREAENHFKELRAEDRGRVEGNYQFSEAALTIKFDNRGNPLPNPDLEQYKKTLPEVLKEFAKPFMYKGKEQKPTTITPYNTMKVSVGMWGPAKISIKQMHMVEDFEKGKITELPDYLIVLVDSKFNDQYTKFDSTEEKKKRHGVIENMKTGYTCNGEIKYDKMNVIIRKLPMVKIVKQVERKSTPSEKSDKVIELEKDLYSLVNDLEAIGVDEVKKDTVLQEGLKEVGRVMKHIETPIIKPLTSSPNMV